jgi:hypothetical protein
MIDKEFYRDEDRLAKLIWISVGGTTEGGININDNLDATVWDNLDAYRIVGVGERSMAELRRLAEVALSDAEYQANRILQEANKNMRGRPITQAQRDRIMREIDINDIVNQSAMIQGQKLIGQVGCNYAPWAVNALSAYEYLDPTRQNLAERAAQDLNERDPVKYRQELQNALMQSNPGANSLQHTVGSFTRDYTTWDRYKYTVAAGVASMLMPPHLMSMVWYGGALALGGFDFSGSNNSSFAMQAGCFALAGIGMATGVSPIVFGAILTAAPSAINFFSSMDSRRFGINYSTMALLAMVATPYMAADNLLGFSPAIKASMLGGIALMGCLMNAGENSNLLKASASMLPAAGLMAAGVPALTAVFFSAMVGSTLVDQMYPANAVGQPPAGGLEGVSRTLHKNLLATSNMSGCFGLHNGLFRNIMMDVASFIAKRSVGANRLIPQDPMAEISLAI